MTVANVEQIAAFGKDNVEALVQSSTLAVKGLEELAKAYAALANNSVEKTSAAVKALATAKTPAEFQAVYGDLAKTNFENFVAEATKLQELANSIITNSFAPLNARVKALQDLVKV